MSHDHWTVNNANVMFQSLLPRRCHHPKTRNTFRGHMHVSKSATSSILLTSQNFFVWTHCKNWWRFVSQCVHTGLSVSSGKLSMLAAAVFWLVFRGVQFESRMRCQLTRHVYHGFCQSLQANAKTVRPWLVPSTSFFIHHSLPSSHSVLHNLSHDSVIK